MDNPDSPKSEYKAWVDDGVRFGWTLPPAAPLFFRLPLIRNIRSAWLYFQIERHYAEMGGLMGCRSGYDEWVRWAVSRGIV